MSFFSGKLYLYHDSDKDNILSPELISVDEARTYNQQGFSVCFMPNKGSNRSNAGVTKIHAWFVDIDFKDAVKPELDVVLDISPLIPSAVVETKNGYHIYFYPRNASLQQFRTIQKGLVQHFTGDPKCVNEARIMRMPNFNHMKDPSNPFMVWVAFESDAIYAERQMMLAFPYVEPEESDDEAKPQHKISSADDVFDRIRHSDSRVILQALSGTSAVGFKSYKFIRRGQHYNIIVDGKDSGCFVNEKGNVIGTNGYSGGAVEWLTWYGHNRVDAMKLICEAMQWD